MERPSTYHHGNLRAALIACGKKLLQEQGAHELSLRSVTREAGVSPGAPRHFFGDLNGLLSAIAVEGFEEMIALRESALLSAQDPADRLRRVLHVYIDFAVEKPGLFWVMIGPMITDRYQRPEISEVANRSYSILQRCVYGYLVSIGMEHACKPELVQCVWSAMHGVSMLFSGRPHGPDISLPMPFLTWKTAVIDFALAGLRSRAQELSPSAVETGKDAVAPLPPQKRKRAQVKAD